MAAISAPPIPRPRQAGRVSPPNMHAKRSLKAQVLTALQDAGLDTRLRPEQLTLQDFCALQTALTNLG